MTEPNEHGTRLVFFNLNGQTRSVEIKDNAVETDVVAHEKASEPSHVGSPLQGSLSKILVKEGDEIEVNTPLFIIEAMKMESTITSPMKGRVERIYLSERTMVQQDDLVIELEIEHS